MSSTTTPLILGTRGSDLAMMQAHMTRDALLERGIACEIQVIQTIGDKRPDLKLSEFSQQLDGVHDKGVFTKELEEALLAGDIDFAVHSLKDVPTELGDSFEICATLPRAPISDILLMSDQQLAADLATEFNRVQSGLNRVQKKFNRVQCPILDGKTVATSSVRRAAQLQWVFPGVITTDIRGNVPTRIRKLIENDEWDGTILARAGLQRLGIYEPGEPVIELEGQIVYVQELPAHVFHPAASQGAVAMEVLTSNDWAKEALAQINHSETFAQATAERSFLAALQAGCQTPVGVCTELSDDGQRLEIDAVVFSEEDLSAAPRFAKATVDIEEAETAGQLLLEALD